MSISDVAHEAHNWLHHLVLAIIIAEAETVARCFAREGPLHVSGSTPEQVWQSWDEWEDALQRTLGPIKPADLSLYLVGKPKVTWDEQAPERAQLQWVMQLTRRSQPGPPRALSCEATLVRVEQRWRASRLSWAEVTLDP